MRFELVLSRYTFEGYLLMFSWDSFFKYYSVHTKKLHSIKLRRPSIFARKFKCKFQVQRIKETHSIVSCSTRDNSIHDLCIMTFCEIRFPSIGPPTFKTNCSWRKGYKIHYFLTSYS